MQTFVPAMSDTFTLLCLLMILMRSEKKSQDLVGKPRANHKLSKRDRTPGSASSMCATLMAQPSSLCSRPLKQSIVVNSVLGQCLGLNARIGGNHPAGTFL